MKIALNVKETVWVRLTAAGVRLYQKYASSHKHIPSLKAEIWHEFPLNRLMMIFGPEALWSEPLFVDNEIRLDKPA